MRHLGLERQSRFIVGSIERALMGQARINNDNLTTTKNRLTTHHTCFSGMVSRSIRATPLVLVLNCQECSTHLGDATAAKKLTKRYHNLEVVRSKSLNFLCYLWTQHAVHGVIVPNRLNKMPHDLNSNSQLPS